MLDGSVTWVALASVVAACAGEPAGVRMPSAHLEDGEHELVIEQRYRAGCGPVHTPSEPVPDRCYERLTPGVRYPVRVSAHGTHVEIVGAGREGASVRGSVDLGPGADHVFQLDLFAGGRLRIRGTDPRRRAAELSVFGSGVPIVTSERGYLTLR